jgi:hypothetical protein
MGWATLWATFSQTHLVTLSSTLSLTAQPLSRNSFILGRSQKENGRQNASQIAICKSSTSNLTKNSAKSIELFVFLHREVSI